MYPHLSDGRSALAIQTAPATAPASRSAAGTTKMYASGTPGAMHVLGRTLDYFGLRALGVTLLLGRACIKPKARWYTSATLAQPRVVQVVILGREAYLG